MSKVGASFFRSYFSFDSTRCVYRHFVSDDPRNISDRAPHWTFVYRFRIPDKPFIDRDVTVRLGLDGVPRAPRPGLAPIEMSDCARDSSECEFPIDEATAMDLARKAGYETGLKPWTAGFAWNTGRGFHWSIRNTLTSEKEGCIETGQMLMIDANTGAQIGTKEWYSICDRIRKGK